MTRAEQRMNTENIFNSPHFQNLHDSVCITSYPLTLCIFLGFASGPFLPPPPPQEQKKAGKPCLALATVRDAKCFAMAVFCTFLSRWGSARSLLLNNITRGLRCSNGSKCGLAEVNGSWTTISQRGKQSDPQETVDTKH